MTMRAQDIWDSEKIVADYSDRRDFDPDPRVRVSVIVRGEVVQVGRLCDDSFGSDWFEVAERGVRTSYRWDRIDRIQVVRP